MGAKTKSKLFISKSHLENPWRLAAGLFFVEWRLLLLTIIKNTSQLIQCLQIFNGYKNIKSYK